MVLVVQGLSKAYGEVVVADLVDITLGHCECLGVIGPNGAGKSSLFHMLPASGWMACNWSGCPPTSARAWVSHAPSRSRSRSRT